MKYLGTKQMSNQLSIVIPVYNGAKSLTELCQHIIESIHDYCDIYEIILIDDYSVDHSWLVIEDLCKHNQQIKGIKLAHNFGQQNAVFCGLAHSKYEYVVTMDDDMQHNPKYIMYLLEKLKLGYDVVYGYGKQLYIHKYRKLGSKLTNWTFNRLLHKPENIHISSFRIMRQCLVRKIIEDSKNYVYISAQIFRLSHKVTSIEIESFQRKYGDSNYTFRKLATIFFKILIYYSKNPLFKLLRRNTDIYIIEKEINIQ